MNIQLLEDQGGAIQFAKSDQTILDNKKSKAENLTLLFKFFLFLTTVLCRYNAK